MNARKCLECGKEYTPRRKESKYCSRECSWKNNGGHNKKKESWWVNQKGYIEGKIWINDHTQIRVKQHRWVWGNENGKIPEGYDIHHVDGNRQNNEISNLEMIQHSEHTCLTNKREYNSGYKMRLSCEERKRRSEYAKKQNLYKMGQAELARRREENN